MNPMPLSWMLIAFAVLTAGLAGTGRLAMHYHQQIGEIRAECNTEALKADNLALRNQAAAYQEAAILAASAAREAQERDNASAKLASKYRRQLNEARAEDPTLDTALSERTRERLRNYEAEYQAGSVRPGAAAPAGPPLR